MGRRVFGNAAWAVRAVFRWSRRGSKGLWANAAWAVRAVFRGSGSGVRGGSIRRGGWPGFLRGLLATGRSGGEGAGDEWGGSGGMAAYAVITKRNRLELPAQTPKAIVQLVRLCWQEKPEARPTFQKLVEMLPSLAEGIRPGEIEFLDNPGGKPKAAVSIEVVPVPVTTKQITGVLTNGPDAENGQVARKTSMWTPFKRKFAQWFTGKYATIEDQC
ncbi:hypothetical protein CYMTET_45723 [Cymbomonas tetramitiformis]|uniref:Serine-threonine/tyrosine-protein kinase catalytic domain-containing protein n=1 Tax=Cymbomonas tetramitiformis TaxID=36881 RepID=A0AAE0BXM6_9CHLO|nr:hypothetical protein CYMTET_45723 [Cymbomonas tetramitiformis]